MTIEELEVYFKSVELPKAPVQLNPSHRITDVELFLSSHLMPLKGQPLPFNAIARPMYERLIEFKTFLENNDSHQ